MNWDDVKQRKEESIRESTNNPMVKNPNPFEHNGKTYKSFSDYLNSDEYKEFLKIDFPRVPYPENQQIFWELVKLGEQLRKLHLLESSILENYITEYPIDGNNRVEKIKYENEKVYINEIQYFNGVPEIAWNFYIGGYQPAQKWLKDRKDKNLEFNDILHYQKIIVALIETDKLMKEIKLIY